MTTTSKLFLAVLTVAAFLVFASSSEAKNKLNESMIVSTDWLAKHLEDTGLVLLQVGEKKEYDEAHIPGAHFIRLQDIATPRDQRPVLELPSVDLLKAAFEKLGVTDKSRIVIYFGKDWVTQTARVFLTLDYLGLGDRTSILDGGLPAWRTENRAVTAEVPQSKQGSFTPHPNAKLVVDAAWVNANLNKPGVAIVDARAVRFYTGEEATQMPRSGHIPSAKSIPFSSVVEEKTNKFKSAEGLRSLFGAAGVKEKDTVASYCHIGQQASLLYFVARYLGYEAHLYDGSFEDWSSRSELPVEKSEPLKPAKP